LIFLTDGKNSTGFGPLKQVEIAIIGATE